MGRVNGFAIALIVALAPVALEACGDVTENTQATASASGGAGGRGTKNDPMRRSKGGMKRMDVAMGAAGAASGSGGSGDAAQTDPIDPASTCSICVRAENCCKAQGLTDCDYGTACANATPSERFQFYLALCRSVLEASRAGDKVLRDVCSF